MTSPSAPQVFFAAPKEVAATLGFNEKTIRRWCIAGRVRAERVPGGIEWRIEVDANGKPLTP